MDEAVKRFGWNPRMARVYVYRNTHHGRAELLGLRVDGADVGTIASYTYMPLELSPGLHRLSARNESETTLELNLLPGRSYFVQATVEISMGAGKPELIEMQPLEAQHYIINECVLVLPTQYGFDVAP